MRKPDGCILLDGIESADTITCGHCNSIVIVSKVDLNFASCCMCNSFICLNCDRLGICTPFMKKLEEIERKTIRDNHYRRLGIL